MTTSIRSSLGRKVIAANSADEIGNVKTFVIDPTGRQITHLQIAGRKRSAQVVDWAQLASFGADAVIVHNADAVHDVVAERTGDMVRGTIDLLGSRLLSTDGVQVGTVTDVDFDETSGQIEAVATEHGRIDGTNICSLGSYALIFEPTD